MIFEVGMVMIVMVVVMVVVMIMMAAVTGEDCLLRGRLLSGTPSARPPVAAVAATVAVLGLIVC